MFIGTATAVYLAQKPQDIRNYAAENMSTNTPPALSPLGEQKTLVVLFNFQDDPNNKPFTKEEASAAILSNTGRSVNTYYQENSYGQTWLTGEVVGWYTIPYDSQPGCYTAPENINPILTQNGVNLDSYPRRIYIHPFTESCESRDSGSTGGNPSTITADDLNLYSLAHEFGHNLTLGHANSATCGLNKVIDDYSNCTFSTYGDPFGVMGHSWEGYHHNAFFKSWLGWIPPSRILEITRSGDYTLAPLELPSNGHQLLKIRKPDTFQYYTLEYRQPYGFDNSLPTTISEGVLIHIAYFRPYERNLITYQSPETYLLDNTPNSQPGYNDASLSDDKTFYDEINNIRITQLSHTNSSVTLRVELDENSCTPELPKLDVITLIQTGLPGQTLIYEVTLTNNDPLNCSSTTFVLDKDNTYFFPGWSYNFSPQSLQLQPQTSQSVTYSVISSYDAENFTYPADIKVTDVNNSYHAKTAKVSYTILNNISPTITTSITSTQISGDANSDSRVNILDFEILRGQFNQSGSNLTADFNNDNNVNILDFEILRTNFGKTGN